MLVKDYVLDIFTPPCEPGAERWSAIARLTVDIGQVLPYLNATLRGAVYNRAANALTWKKGGRTIVFHSYEIAASNFENREEAERVIRGIIQTVNRTWERRVTLEPSYEERQRPTPMALFKLLPGSNCKACGQPTCFTFALKLAAGQQSLSDCAPLAEPAYADQLSQLRAMLPDAPAIT
ncbi:Fe-S cluster protein [Candidatus Parcubacteria bacterium]|nr:MAG: Fe-S cluster protein [Candidatus Parcubacteria bacterium]